jgi:hypothetical protein
VLQFIDAWTNNFAYIGRRATGTAEAEYLLTDRDYDGPVPDGRRVVAAPTGVFTIVGRVQLNGEADLPAVNPLQDQFTITPPGGPGRRLARGGGDAPGGWSSALHAFDTTWTTSARAPSTRPSGRSPTAPRPM